MRGLGLQGDSHVRANAFPSNDERNHYCVLSLIRHREPFSLIRHREPALRVWRSRLSFLWGAFFLLPHASASDAAPIQTQTWSFQGATGTFDRAGLQRGFQVYKEVCSACHGLKRIRLRELKALGFSDEELKALAATYEIPDRDDEGEPKMRKGLPSDAFPDPFKNDAAARAANNGALPPDLSLMIKARPGGADYMYALLTGFTSPPDGHTIPEGMYYNIAFPGNQIAMAPPFVDGQVTYADGTQATIEQMARDVTTFLAWAAEPEVESRKAMGWRVLMFVFVFTTLMGLLMQRIWRRVGPLPEKRPRKNS